MNRKALIITLVTFGSFIAIGGDPKYPVSAIAEELKKDVNVVFREDHMVFKILSKSKASHYVHQVITIFNEKGKRYASETVGYDKMSKIKDLNGAVYDANGIQIKRLRNNEIYDQSAFDGFSLYSDNRFKAINLSQATYPYTVEFEYEIELKYLFYIPGFVLVPGEKISVEHASYALEFPSNLQPRYKTNNTEVKPTEGKTKDGLQSLTWKFENIKPIKIEPLASAKELLTTIHAAPSEFEYDNYSGNMKTWDEFGLWISSLNSGRNVLPEETKNKIKKLTANLRSPEEKIQAVYQYLQSKTRYVSIQLGIGGFQPFEASVVDQTGYGDCKALSNYTVALLDAIGIKALYALIKAGEDASGLEEDFPSSQFNHAIVAVPNGPDTVWLECTSQSNPFGYQGRFTGDRKALLITDRGAKIVNTTRYSAEQNIQSRTADVVIDISGDAKAVVKTSYAGIQYENSHLNFILNNQYDEQKKWLQENISIPSFDINSFSMADNKKRVPSAVVNLELSMKRYATVSGKRMFLTPNLMNKSSYIPDKVESRKTKVLRKITYTDLDTIRYKLPEGIYPEFLPAPVKLQNQFGEYEATFKVEEGYLLYVRKVKMNKGEFPAETYQELVDFYKNINKADNTKVVFMSKT